MKRELNKICKKKKGIHLAILMTPICEAVKQNILYNYNILTPICEAVKKSILYNNNILIQVHLLTSR